MNLPLPAVARLLLTPLLLTAVAIGPASAQDIGFDPSGPTVKLVPFYEFEGNFGDFFASAGGGPAGTPTSATPLLPTDIERLPNGQYLVNTLGGSIKLLDTQGTLRGELLGPAETGSTKVDPVRYGSVSLELHPDFGTPAAFGYGKAYQVVTQLPSEGSRRGLAESGINADFSAPNKRAFGDTTANGITGLYAGGSAFNHQTVVREYDLSAWAASGFAADTLTGGAAPPSRDVLRVDMLGGNHGTYDLAFNAAGDLFVTTGDGGFNEGASHPDYTGRNRRQSSQNPNEIFGKVFRINPDINATNAGRVGQNGQYSIPADNPYYDNTADPAFVLPIGVDPENDGDPNTTVANSTVFQNNDGTLDEIYAVGLRSPIRLENDPRDPSGNTLILGDVGGGSREEATLFTLATTGPDTGKAPNLGWGRFEGTTTGNGSISLAPDSQLLGPNFQYDHSEQGLTRSGGVITGFNNETGGIAIEGGEIYAGELLGSELQGKYFAAELGFHNVNTVELSRLILGDFDNPGTFTAVNLDPSGQRFDSPQLTEEDFADGFDFNQPGIDFFGDGTRLLPDRIYGVYADNVTGELFLLGGSTQGNATISRIVPVGFEGPLAGDYNDDGRVDAADYTVWRDANGATGVELFAGADGNGDGRIDHVDYQVWRDNYGALAPSDASGTIPEPSALGLACLAAMGWMKRRER